jgi:hypothetical protein
MFNPHNNSYSCPQIDWSLTDIYTQTNDNKMFLCRTCVRAGYSVISSMMSLHLYEQSSNGVRPPCIMYKSCTTHRAVALTGHWLTSGVTLTSAHHSRTAVVRRPITSQTDTSHGAQNEWQRSKSSPASCGCVDDISPNVHHNVLTHPHITHPLQATQSLLVFPWGPDMFRDVQRMCLEKHVHFSQIDDTLGTFRECVCENVQLFLLDGWQTRDI